MINMRHYLVPCKIYMNFNILYKLKSQGILNPTYCHHKISVKILKSTGPKYTCLQLHIAAIKELDIGFHSHRSHKDQSNIYKY